VEEVSDLEFDLESKVICRSNRIF